MSVLGDSAPGGFRLRTPLVAVVFALALLSPLAAPASAVCMLERPDGACTVSADPASPGGARYRVGDLPPAAYCQDPSVRYDEGGNALDPCPNMVAYVCVMTSATPYNYVDGGVGVPTARSGLFIEQDCVGLRSDNWPGSARVGAPVDHVGVFDGNGDGEGDTVYVAGQRVL